MDMRPTDEYRDADDHRYEPEGKRSWLSRVADRRSRTLTGLSDLAVDLGASHQPHWSACPTPCLGRGEGIAKAAASSQAERGCWN
ncbi:hypothetical protein V2G26_016920 [Clonostachys chloroleuca]